MTDYEQPKWKCCPDCASTAPQLHPAVQFEGEVELCTHDFHLTRSNQNRPEYIAAVLAKRALHDGWSPLAKSAAS